MAPRTTTKAAAEKPPKKNKSPGVGRKKLTAFNKFMQTEMARLRDEQPDISHQERYLPLNLVHAPISPSYGRFKAATANWKTAKEKAS
ncbi:hypothetical protein C0995_015142 [Termitomyces sp. Mi166|nr:hypothetical protein C0995_015142 [Termitomyces sp. Mi166\